ncbi:dimethylaniline monooxygenase [Moniliophthora roreri]|uniref:Putative FAD/NAD-P-binding domain-containing protein n=1 Tax=Moniliophthora roreri TaxID=221103 RepID=A0A0W0FT16_MONRR|nr:dimethylaniline monooxygenase [Moniliophthora roreri]
MVANLRSITFLLATASAFASEQVILNADLHTPSKSPWTVFESPIKRVAVIGAGPAGLQAAATLMAHNFTVRLFDRAPGPGGNWLYSEEVPVREAYPDEEPGTPKWIPADLPASRYYSEGDDGIGLDERWCEHWLPRPVWDSLHTNSPSIITGLTDVPYPPDHSWVLSHYTIQKHVKAYASLHELNIGDSPSVTAYATRVEKLEKSPSNSSWTLTLRHLERLKETNRIKATWWTEEADAVVVATGPYDSSHVPKIKGLVEWSKVKSGDKYSINHSRVYRTPRQYAGKTVLIIGASVSGSEIARDIAPHAKKEYDWEKLHPFRRRSILRIPSEVEFIPEIAAFEPLSAFDGGISEGTIRLINGTSVRGVDEIILATGYRRANAFLNAILNDTVGIEGSDKNTAPSDIFGGNPLRNVHWTGHYIPDPTLAFTNVRPWTAGHYQSYALAKVWEGTARIPNEEELWRQYNSTRYNNFRGLFGTGPSEAIVRQYVAWLNNESLEHGGRLVGPWPVQNREVFSYYANLEWERDYISRNNFTRFENLPADEWSKEDLWDVSVLEDLSW